MTADESPRASPSHRRGFWVFVGVAFFAIGVPTLGCVYASRPIGVMTLIAAVFFLLAFLTSTGLNWARIAMALGCGLTAAFLLLRMLQLLALTPPGQTQVFLLVLFVVMFLPALGFVACAALLCLPSVIAWQAHQRQVHAAQILRERQNRSLAQNIPDTADLERCPWCEYLAVYPGEDYCRSCNRPVG